MQLHNSNESVNFLKEHLPGRYVEKTLERLGWEKDKTNIARVRNVRYGFSKDSIVLLTLIEIANENKEAAEAVRKIISN